MPGEGALQDASQPLETTLVRPSEWTSGAALAPPAPAFSAGTVIQKALAAWWKNVVPFTIASFVAYAPFAAGYLWLMRQVLPTEATPEQTVGASVPDAVIGFLFIGGSLVTLFLITIVHGGVAYATFRHLRGARAGFGGLLAEGLKRGFFVFMVMLVAWLPIGLGVVLFLAPGLMLASAWAFCVPACVVERLGPIASLSRSAELTRGHRMQVFLGILGLMGVMWAASMAIQLVASVVVIAAMGPEKGPFAILAVSQLGSAVFGLLPAIGATTAYHELRVAREGLDAGHLAAVFD